MYKKAKLANDLSIIANQMPDRHSVSLGIWIKVGGRYESAVNKGISHFMEHLLFKGTQKYSCNQIKESIEGIGGALNGFTSEELTCYLVKIPAKYLKLALEILSDMVLHPLLPENEIIKERQVILEELKMYRDLPQSYVYELLDELLWPGQPLGTPIIGTVDTVSSITRQDLFNFRQQHYSCSNIVVSAAGCLDYEQLAGEVQKIFSAEEPQAPNIFVKATEGQEAPQIKLFPKNTEQTHLAMGFHSFRRDHPLKHALGLLHVILGGNMSSRLFNELREERALAYEIGTQVKRFYDTGVFLVHAGIDNRKVGDAISLVLEELKKIKEKLVTEDEFKRAKEFYLGQLTLALEDTMDSMLWIGESTAVLGKTYSLQEVIEEVGLIKREDVLRVAGEIFKSTTINCALIGPLEDKQQEIFSRLRIG